MKKTKFNIDLKIFIPTLLVFIVMSLIMITSSEEAYSFLSRLLGLITKDFGWAYLCIYIANFVFLGWLAFGRYGKIRFGKPDEKPEYGKFAWICMVFTTGIDASIMIMSLFEPLQYLQAPPFEIEPFSNQAYDYAHMYGQFHWGPSAWMMYIPATIAIAYVLYVKNGDTTRVSTACAAAFGNKKKVWHKYCLILIDIIVVFGIMGGIGASIGLEIPVISQIISTLLGTENTIGMKLFALLLLLVLFGGTVYLGLDKGIQNLSTINIYVVLAFLGVMFIVGPTLYIVDSEINSVGMLLSNFVRMSTYTDPNVQSGFPQNWTMFYWGWWLAYMPVMGLFVARISRGRTIRQVITGEVLWGSLGCMTFFGVMGGYSLYLQKTGTVDLVSILNEQGQEAAIAAVIQSLPMSKIMLVAYCISCFIFLATTVSSSAFIISSMTSRKLTGYEQPARWNRLLWAVVFVMFSAGIMIVGGFETIQVVCVIAGFPLIAVCIVLMKSIYNMVREHDI